MDRQYIRDQQVIERYLQGKLTPSEEQAFEELYLADAQLLEELKLAERLRQGFKDLDAGGQADAPRGGRPRGGWSQLLASPRYATAASVIAAVGLLSSSLLYWQNRDLREGAAGAPLVAASSTRLLPLLSVRGSNNVNVVDAPAADEWTVLLLDAGFTDYDDYRAILYRRSGDVSEEILRLEGMTPTYEGLLALGLAGAQLPPGDYEVELSGRTAGAIEPLTRTPLTVSQSRSD